MLEPLYLLNAWFLGVTLDEHLTGEGHCNVVANKMARYAGILNIVKNQIPLDSMKIIYNSLIFPHYSYSLELNNKKHGGVPAKIIKTYKIDSEKICPNCL